MCIVFEVVVDIFSFFLAVNKYTSLLCVYAAEMGTAQDVEAGDQDLQLPRRPRCLLHQLRRDRDNTLHVLRPPPPARGCYHGNTTESAGMEANVEGSHMGGKLRRGTPAEKKNLYGIPMKV